MRFRLLTAWLLFLGLAAVRAQDDTNGFTLRWSVAFPGKGAQSSPALAPDGTVYFGTFNGTLLAFTPEGKTKWQFKLKSGMEIHASPAVGADGTIYFGARDRNFYAVSPVGKLKWKFPAAGWVDSSPAIAVDGTVYFGSWDGNFYALTPDGKPKWKFTVGSIIYASPAIAADGTIFFGAHDGNFYALTPDGKLKWKFTTGGVIDASAAIATDGTIYFSSADGNLYALTAAGALRWRVRTGGYTPSSAVLDEDGNIYLTAARDFYFISPEGKVIFTTPGEVPMDGSPAATANREVVFSIPWLRIGAFRRDHPWPPHWYHIDSNVTGSPNVGTDGTIYASSLYTLYAVQPPNPAPPAKSSWPLWRGDAQQTGRVQRP
jgi:outer membrane protein assembly factor BamB